MTDQDFQTGSWTHRIEWMRKLGVAHAEWTPDGQLTKAVLGPPPGVVLPPLTPEEEEAAMKRAQAELDALAYASA